MTAIISAKSNCSNEGKRVVTTSKALETGIFYPISNLDPDINSRVRVTRNAPAIWSRFFPKSR